MSKFKPLLEAVGIRVPRGDSCYILRHGSATLMSSFGALRNCARNKVGHADGSPNTESFYTHVISEDGKRVAAQLGIAVWGVLDAIGRKGMAKTKTAQEWSPPGPFVIN